MFARDYRRISRDRLAGRWALAVGVGLLASLLGSTLVSVDFRMSWSISESTVERLPPLLVLLWMQIAPVLGLLGVAQFVVGGVVRQGYCQFLLNLHDQKKANVRDLFSQFHRFGDGFLLRLLMSLFTFLWMLLFLIPGFVAALRYAMAPYILLEHPGISPMDAIRASTAMMQGHKWELFCLRLSFIGWILLLPFTLGFGLLWLVPYMNSADAAFYREISRN